MTNRQRWQEIDRIFAAVLERDDAERPAFLDEACGSDERLRKEVESLIAHIVPESLVEGQALEEATRLLVNGPTEPAIESIGRYKITRLLGAGGMGRVYLGRDEQLNRHVAIKLLTSGEPRFQDLMRRVGFSQ